MTKAISDELLRGDAPCPADISALLALLGHPRVAETLGGVGSEIAVRRLVTRWGQMWSVRGFGPWIFRYRPTASFVGYAGLAPAPDAVEPGSLELLYALRPEFWGRGFATRMASLSLEHAFSERGVAEVIAYTLTANRASRRVLDKLGFTLERRLEYAGLPHGLYRLCLPSAAARSFGRRGQSEKRAAAFVAQRLSTSSAASVA